MGDANHEKTNKTLYDLMGTNETRCALCLTELCFSSDFYGLFLISPVFHGFFTKNCNFYDFGINKEQAKRGRP